MAPSCECKMIFLSLTSCRDFQTDFISWLPKLTFTDLLGFHGTFETGLTCKWTLTPSDTWICPFLNVNRLFIVETKCVLIFRSFQFQYLSALSRFYFSYRYIDDVWSNQLGWGSSSHSPLGQTWLFQFPYDHILFLISYIPSSPTYCVCISQFIRLARGSFSWLFYS